MQIFGTLVVPPENPVKIDPVCVYVKWQQQQKVQTCDRMVTSRWWVMWRAISLTRVVWQVKPYQVLASLQCFLIADTTVFTAVLKVPQDLFGLAKFLLFGARDRSQNVTLSCKVQLY